MQKNQKNEFLICSNGVNNFKFAAKGVLYATISQLNLWFHLVIAITLVTIGLPFNIRVFELLFVFFVFGLIINVKLINSFVETRTGQMQSEKQKLAKLIKELGGNAAAQFRQVNFFIT